MLSEAALEKVSGVDLLDSDSYTDYNREEVYLHK